MAKTKPMPGRLILETHGSALIARLDGGPQGLMGLNMADGKVCFREISEQFNLPYTSVEEILA